MNGKSSKLNVCMLIDTWFPFIGGGQIHVQNLIYYLEKKYQVKISLFHAPNHHIIIRGLWCFWVIPQVLLVSSHQHFHLIHAHAFAAGLPGKILSLLLNIPIIYTVHGSHLMDSGQKNIKSWMEAYLLTKISYNAQVSVTKSFLKYPNVNKKISVIRNGVDLSKFNSVKVKKNTKFTLLYIGRDHPTKGISILKQAFDEVKLVHPQIKLKLITGGITGKKLIREYKQAHVFVLPSLVEGQPIVLLEAWAAKLPVIATKTPGVAEIVTHNYDAILIRPGDATQLSHAISQIYQMNPIQRRNLGQNGYQKVKQFFTWQKVAAATFKIYQQILQEQCS